MNSLHVSQHPCAPAGDEGYAAGETGSTGKLAEAKQAITRTARNTTQQLKTAAADTASRVRETAERVATEKKELAAKRIGGYSAAVHESAKSLEEEDPNIAWFTHQAADRLQGVADYVRTQDFAGLRRDAENFARRHPAAFFGGLFALGLVAGNVIKASQRKSSGDPAPGSDETQGHSDETQDQAEWNPPETGQPQGTGSPASTPSDVNPPAGF